MSSPKKKTNPQENIEAFEIKLERIPVENLAEASKTADLVRTTTQKLISKIAEAADKYAEASDELDKGGARTYSDAARSHLEKVSTDVGKVLNVLDHGMRIYLSAAAAKQKINS